MPTPLCRAARVLPSLLLAAASVAIVPAAGAVDAAPSPSPVWDTLLDTTSTTSFGPYGTMGQIDAFGANTYRAESSYDSAASETSYLYEVFDKAGQRTFRDAGGADIDAGLTAVDAGSWGAVVGGSVSGAFPGATYAGSTDGWVRRYAPDGTVEWTTQFGTSSSDLVYDVAVLGDQVVAVGSSAGDVLLYSFDLATGASEGPITLDVGTPQSAQLGAVAVLGDDLVVTGSTDRDIDVPDGTPSGSYGWIARLDGNDLTQIVWETNGIGGNTSGSPFGNPVAVLGGNVYVTSTSSGFQGAIVSFNGATGALRWTKALGVYQIPTSLTTYRGDLVVAGAVITGFATGSSIQYDSLLRGYSPAGAKLWTGGVDEDDSDGLVYLTSAAATPQAGLVVSGLVGESTSTTTFGRFLSGLRVRAPKTLVKTTGGFKPEASASVKRGRSVGAQVKLTNAGELADRVALKGCVTPASVTLQVKDGKKDVTSTVRNGKYRTGSLGVGKATTLSVTVTAGPKANLRTLVCKLESSSVANPDNVSTAVLKVTIKK